MVNVLVVTKGHTYDYSAFHAMFDDNPILTTTFVEQPAAQIMLRPENVAPYDVVLFYDMCGVPTLDGPKGAIPAPPSDYVRSIESLLESGKGLVLLNHALAQWSEWPLWREISGTTFRMAAGEVNGQPVPASGYRCNSPDPLSKQNAVHRLTPVDPTHPVVAGLEKGFEITDELYLRLPLPARADVVPLMTSNFAFVQSNFNPLPLLPAAEQKNWRHPEGDNVIVWAKRTRKCPVVASDAGDCPTAYANPAFRRLLTNAITWVASEEARTWAREGRN